MKRLLSLFLVLAVAVLSLTSCASLIDLNDSGVIDALISELSETSAPGETDPQTPDTAPVSSEEDPTPPGTEPVETEAPETQQPETEAPETKVPETQAPETKAPETTQPPETDPPVKKTIEVKKGSYYYDLAHVVAYLMQYHTLPDNYITKDEAEDLGWSGGTVEKYKSGAAIGGDYFGNYQKILPVVKGRKYTECDLDTNGKKPRGSKRLIFSNDGHYYFTEDHYETFKEVFIIDGEVVLK